MVNFPSFRRSSRVLAVDFEDDNVPLSPANAGAYNAIGLASAPAPRHLTRNKTERGRLQGLMQRDHKRRSALSILSVEGDPKLQVDDDKDGGEGFWTRVRAYMVNEGSKRIFFGVWLLVHAMVFGFGMCNYSFKDNLVNARRTYHITYSIARSAALTLHVDVAFILLPVCRNFISLLRRTPLNGVIPFDKNITFHKAVAWSIVFFTIVHIIAHMFNFAFLAIETNTGIVGFVGANFLTGPGATGWIMTISLGVMTFFAVEKRKRAHFERFWYSHHLFIVLFVCWQLHGMFCMIKPDRPPYCDYNQIGVFWKYWLAGGVIFLYERILREVRSRHKTYISKVIQHPSNVIEIQIRKEKTMTRAGQYIFLQCPEISYWQWHPFTLTSAPEEDYISVHVRMVGDFTKALGAALGCEKSGDDEKEKGGQQEVKPPLNKVLPRVMVDGPFGSASEDYFKFEVAVLVGAGIGVTPFASILKSIWYRLNYPKDGKKTRLQKVYFFWICRDTASLEWFQSLLHAIEEQDLNNHVEIHAYMTGKVKEDDMNNIVLSDVGGERDALTGLRAPTHYGRPNWDRIFSSIRDKHPETDCGVFFCGPAVLGHTLHLQCNKWTSGADGGTRFFWGKENF